MVAAKRNSQASPASHGVQPKAFSQPLQHPSFVPDEAIDKRLQKAMALHEEGKTDEALLIIKKILAEKPRYAPAYFYGGLMRYKQGKFDMAKTNFAKSFSFPEAAVVAHYYLGKIYAAEKYTRGALSEASV